MEASSCRSIMPCVAHLVCRSLKFGLSPARLLISRNESVTRRGSIMPCFFGVIGKFYSGVLLDAYSMLCRLRHSKHSWSADLSNLTTFDQARVFAHPPLTRDTDPWPWAMRDGSCFEMRQLSMTALSTHSFIPWWMVGIPKWRTL